MQTDKRVIEAAEKSAQRSQYLSDFQHYYRSEKHGFIAGIESPINQILKLEALIKENNSIKALNKLHGTDRVDFAIEARIKDLQSQLEELKKQL